MWIGIWAPCVLGSELCGLGSGLLVARIWAPCGLEPRLTVGLSQASGMGSGKWFGLTVVTQLEAEFPAVGRILLFFPRRVQLPCPEHQPSRPLSGPS